MRLATPADRAAVIATVVAAFAQDPAFRFFFPDDDTYAAEAPLFVGALFDDRVGDDATWVLDAPVDHDRADTTTNADETRATLRDAGRAQLASLAMWAPPTTAAHGADLSGLSTESRDRLRVYDQATNDGLPTAPLWYLGILATHPDHSGQRHGRRLMAPGLEASRRSGHPAYLETTNAQNVAMYERAGWISTSVNHIDELTVTVLRFAG